MSAGEQGFFGPASNFVSEVSALVVRPFLGHKMWGLRDGIGLLAGCREVAASLREGWPGRTCRGSRAQACEQGFLARGSGRGTPSHG